jgi:hypothetical protein
MPLDTIKTRMQSLEARTQYRNSFHAGYRIFTEEGLFAFWRGTTPRLGRLIVSRHTHIAEEYKLKSVCSCLAVSFSLLTKI